MAQYIVQEGVIVKKGKGYKKSETIELTKAEAERLGKKVKAVEVEQTQNKLQDGIKAEDMSMDELKQVVEAEGIEVEGTGKNGAIKKEDYINALGK